MMAFLAGYTLSLQDLAIPRCDGTEITEEHLVSLVFGQYSGTRATFAGAQNHNIRHGIKCVTIRVTKLQNNFEFRISNFEKNRA